MSDFLAWACYPPVLLDALFWTFALLATAVTLLSVKRGRQFLDYVEERVRERGSTAVSAWPATALIVPVKGREPGLARNLRALSAQDYPSFELVVVCADASDPACEAARCAVGHTARIVVAGEPPPGTGEKIHNLLAAVKAVGGSAEILAFADSDGRVRKEWLRSLVAPLVVGGVGATTTFRWYVPEEGGFWPLVRTVWDSSIATIMDTRDRSFAWGGGMALRREVFESAEVAQFWRGAVSDDYRLTDAMSAAGLGIRFIPEAMVETPGTCTGTEFLAWTVRQLTIARVYSFRRWLEGYLSHVVYCVAQILCVTQVLFGNPLAGFGALLLIVLPGMARGSMRGYVCALVFPHREAWLERFGWAYFWMTPVATWVWLHAFVRSGLTRRIAWRGRVYELLGPGKSKEIGRA